MSLAEGMALAVFVVVAVGLVWWTWRLEAEWRRALKAQRAVRRDLTRAAVKYAVFQVIDFYRTAEEAPKPPAPSRRQPPPSGTLARQEKDGKK